MTSQRHADADLVAALCHGVPRKRGEAAGRQAERDQRDRGDEDFRHAAFHVRFQTASWYQRTAYVASTGSIWRIASRRIDDRRHRAPRANEDDRRLARQRPDRHIRDRDRPGRALADGTGDAHDGEPGPARLVALRERDATADGIGARRIGAGEVLVDNRDRVAGKTVLRRERPSLNQRYPQGVEVSRVDTDCSNRRRGSLASVAPLDGQFQRSGAGARHRRCDPDGGGGPNRLQRLAQPSEQRPPLQR